MHLVEVLSPPSSAKVERTAFFLKAEAGLPVECDGDVDAEAAARRVEPSANLRHSHQLRLGIDYWAQCSACQKWRIVDFTTYCVAREAMSTFYCANGNCSAPQTEEELAGLEEAKHL